MLYGYAEFESGEASEEMLRELYLDALKSLGPRKRVLIVPPDITRLQSYAGQLTRWAWQYYGSAVKDILPALGTHVPMNSDEISRMYNDVPHKIFRVHDWRRDAVTVGTIPSEVVCGITGGRYDGPWEAQANRMIVSGGYDSVLSIGQVVPHVVAGMANHNKNIFIGTGGKESINISHYLSASIGVESILGRKNNPVRELLNYASDHFTAHLPIVYVLTVMAQSPAGNMEVRGLYVGDDLECFDRAADLSLRINVTRLEKPVPRIVTYMDENEYRSTWLANKAVFRTRLAIADGGEILVIAPGVRSFGEDSQIDKLIRRVGYRCREEIAHAIQTDPELLPMLGAAAHAIQSAPDGRFRVSYATKYLCRSDLENVGYNCLNLSEALRRYSPEKLRPGYNTLPDGENVYFVRNPAMGLWVDKARFDV